MERMIYESCQWRCGGEVNRKEWRWEYVSKGTKEYQVNKYVSNKAFDALIYTRIGETDKALRVLGAASHLQVYKV